ncbi:unnamed protein product, partial [Mesorhabditis belari]
MTILFVSDRSVPGSGFSARWNSVDPSVDCDRTFTSPSGEIFFNGSITKAYECQYHISVTPGHRVLLTLNSLEMPCHLGTLSLRNGINDQSPGFHTLFEENEVCNAHNFTELRSFAHRVYLKLKTTNPTALSFNISYKIVSQGCGGHVDGMEGTISAPQYPHKDARSMDCEWNVAVALGNKVRLSIAMVDDLKAGDDQGRCGMNSLSSLDILENAHDGAHYLKRICKKETGVQPILSDDHQLTIRYKQHGGLQFGQIYGFLSHFSTVCTDIVHRTFAGTIQSPGYPNDAYGTRSCSWTIIAPPGNKLEFTFTQFVIQKQSRWMMIPCGQDFLKFGDGEVASAEIRLSDGSINVTNTMETFCSSSGEPITIKTTNNTAHIAFNTKMPTNLFSMTWRTIGCGGEMHDGQKVILSKDQIDQNSDLLECHWVVDAGIGKIPRVILEKLSIYRPDSQACDPQKEDFTGLGIYYGRSNSSGHAMKALCEPTVDYNYTAHAPELFLRLTIPMRYIKSTGSEQFMIFSVFFLDSNGTDDCSGLFKLNSTDSVTVHSPGYPNLYSQGVSCKYVFETEPGFSPLFEVKAFYPANDELVNAASFPWLVNLYKNYSCQLIPGSASMEMQGNLEFYGIQGSNQEQFLIDRICSKIIETKNITVPNQKALVKFHAASLPPKKGEIGKDKIGWMFTVEPLCGGIVIATDKQQQFTVMDLKTEYCNLTFIADPALPYSDVYVRFDDIFMRYRPNERTDVMEPATVSIQIDGGIWESRHIETMQSITGSQKRDEFRGTREVKISIKRAEGIFRENIIFTYMAGSSQCGGELTRMHGYLVLPDITNSKFECEWTVRHFSGSNVKLRLNELVLPHSESCAASYLEIRRNNETGTLIGRFCNIERAENVITGESFWIKLKYEYVTPDNSMNEYEETEEIDSTLNNEKYKLLLNYDKSTGGETNSSVIEYQSTGKSDIFASSAWFVKGENDKGLLVQFDKIEIPDEDEDQGLFLADGGDDPINMLHIMEDKKRIVGWSPISDLYLDYSSLVIKLYAPSRSSFKLRWQIVPKRDANWTLVVNASTLTPTSEPDFVCGFSTPVVPTVNENYVISPGYPRGYINFLKCKWIFEKPLFYGVQFKVIDLDLESVDGCRYDYAALIPQRGNLAGSTLDKTKIDTTWRLCNKNQINRTFNFNYNQFTNLYFYSDSSRSGKGFKFSYQLTCNSFDYVKAAQGPLNRTITSFRYPILQPEDSCSTAVVLETNRRMRVEILDLDISEEKGPDGECLDYLFVSHRAMGNLKPNEMIPSKNIFCGTLEALDEKLRVLITPLGRLFIKFAARPKKPMERNRRGYKILVTEIEEECANDQLRLDENNSKRTLFTPGWPKLAPNSLNCQWLIAAPNGKRLKFTIDPHNFDIQSVNESCHDDYVEFYDGPTIFSKKIGRFCGQNAPSTIFSTSSFLLVKYRTDSYMQSFAWNATYEIASCGGSIVLRKDETKRLTSPNFPEQYPIKQDCLWTVKAPNAHFVETRLDHLWISFTTNCSYDYLAIHDGNETADYLMDRTCSGGVSSSAEGNEMMQPKRSSTPIVTVEFHANNTVNRGSRLFCAEKKCGFEMRLGVSNLTCGGKISDVSGFITVPGYPNQLLPHISCEWEFQAGIGFGYKFDFEFVDETVWQASSFRASSEGLGKCYTNIETVNGLPSHFPTNFMNDRYFCENRTTFITTADLATIRYNDFSSRNLVRYTEDLDLSAQYRPFRINYKKIPQKMMPEYACMTEITRNMSFFLATKENNTDNPLVFQRAEYCHLVLRKTAKYGTVSIKISEFQSISPIHYAFCTNYGSYVDIQSAENDPWPVKERICNATIRMLQGTDTSNPNRETFVATFVNDLLHLHVWAQMAPNGLKGYTNLRFNMSVEFQECGGFIRSPNMGTITSPNYGEGMNYLPNSYCMWILEAPEGQLVQVILLFCVKNFIVSFVYWYIQVLVSNFVGLAKGKKW